jgi:uncharacterized protein (TIGR03435 family)
MISKRVAAGLVMLGLLRTLAIHAQSTQSTGGPLPSFEVATIKRDRSGGPGNGLMLPPGRFTATKVSAKMLVSFAYNGNRSGFSLRDDQVSGGPDWINSEEYDIDAKVDDTLVSSEEQKLPFEQWADQVRLMVRALLADRFKLQVSHTTRDLSMYALVVAKGGPKLNVSTVPPLGPIVRMPSGPDMPKGPMIRGSLGEITAISITTGTLADALSRQRELGGREVVDRTALTGRYDFTLKWIPEGAAPLDVGAAADNQASSPESRPESSGPSLFTALQQQLGLKLESTRGPVEVLVIDHIERPSEN